MYINSHQISDFCLVRYVDQYSLKVLKYFVISIFTTTNNFHAISLNG